MEKNAIWERWVVSMTVLPKLALRKCSCCYWETRSNVKGQHVQTRTDNRKQKYIWKKSTFVADFGCNRQIWISFNDCDDFTERKFVSKCRRKNALGVFAMTWATTMPVLVGILKQFLLLFLLSEGFGARGVQIQSVINEHFKRPNCGR